jgi:hypothetical protein
MRGVKKWMLRETRNRQFLTCALYKKGCQEKWIPSDWKAQRE